MTWWEDELSKYEIAYTRFKEGLFTEEEFSAYCMDTLETIMKNFKDVLDRLKNC